MFQTPYLLGRDDIRLPCLKCDIWCDSKNIIRYVLHTSACYVIDTLLVMF